MKKVNVSNIAKDVEEIKKARYTGNMDDYDFFHALELGWKEKNAGRNLIKELLGDDTKLADSIAAVSDDKMKKKVKLYQRQRIDPSFLAFDVREKMESYSLQEHIEAVWNVKFRQNGCQCHLPGHKDKTASCHIYPATNSFYCF